jgi:hypothetical protein
MIIVAVFVHDDDVSSNLVLIGLMLSMILCAWAKPFRKSLTTYNMMEAASLITITLTLVLSKLDIGHVSAGHVAGEELRCNSTLFVVIIMNMSFFCLTILLGAREFLNKRTKPWVNKDVGANWTRLIARITVLDILSGSEVLSREQGVHEPRELARSSRLASQMMLSGFFAESSSPRPSRPSQHDLNLPRDLNFQGIQMLPFSDNPLADEVLWQELQADLKDSPPERRITLIN